MEARSRKYHTMRNGFLMACLLAAITAGGEVRLDKVWEYSENNSMKPAWMGANTERSMAYHDGSLYVISRNGGNKLLQLSSDGILQKATALTGLANGVLTGNNIGITDDGQVLVGSAGQQGFSIQKIDVETGVASDFLTSPSSNVKNGGRIDGWGVAGTMEDGVIAVPVSYVAGTTNGGNEVLIFDISNGAIANSSNPTIVSNINGTSATIATVGTDSFYVLSANFVPKFIEKNEEWQIASEQFPASLYTPATAGGAQFAYQGKTYFASSGGSQYGALQIFDITDGLQNAAEVFTTPAIGATENTFSKTNPVCVDVRADGAYIYVLSTNNGIAAYRLYDTDVFAGTYTVGTGGDYETLSAAMSDIQSRRDEVKGDITLSIISDIEESENVSLSVDLSPYTLTIRPDKAELRTVRLSSPTANAGVGGGFLFGASTQSTDLIATSHIVIDGSAAGNSGRYLKIETAETTNSKTHPIVFYGDVRNVSIRNCIIEHHAAISGVANNYAICFRRSGDTWPQDITIENNEIRNQAGTSSDAIAPDLSTSGGTGTMQGIKIANNKIYAKARGVIVGYVDGIEITGNEFRIEQDANGLTSSAILGFGTVKGKITVDGNKFIQISSANTTASGGGKTIITEGPEAEWQITNNFFGGFEKTSASGSAVFGCIDCNTPSRILHNTFVLNALENKPTEYYAIKTANNALTELKNNIFASKEYSAANAYLLGDPSGASDYNVFAHDESNTAVSFNGIDKTLEQYQANSGNDIHSTLADVEFVDEGGCDFHIAKSSIGNASLLVPRLDGITTDIDGDSRSESTYAGADEPLIPIIAVPTALRATNVTENSFVANWSEIAGATAYKLNVYTKEPANDILKDEIIEGETSFEVTGLEASTNYYYTVSAIDHQFESALSNEILVRTKDKYVEGQGYAIPGFTTSPYFDEQVMAYTYNPDIKVEINAPSAANFDPALPTALVLYGLPNGNSTDWTIGKQEAAGDDWHYQIQHIGAQTRFVRQQNPGFNLVTVYLEAEQQSWGTWRSANKNGDAIIKELTESLLDVFDGLNPYIVLSGHSGGGNFPFGFMDAVESIPSYVHRIVFLDSNYNWDNTRYGSKLADWLNASADNKLVVICYDDVNALLNGEPIVSATGGTWYRSQVMQKYLQDNLSLEWTKQEDDNMIEHRTGNGQIQFLMKKNPNREILHTVLVEKNGYIHSLLFGTPFESEGYEFYGDAAYRDLIQTATVYPHVLRIPPRSKDALTGSAFIEKIKNLPLEEREAEIYKEISSGNVPDAFRKVTTITTVAQDAAGQSHAVELSVVPDFLAVGSDEDFVRMPMLPGTAQRIATLFNATMPTRMLSDLIHENSIVKLSPVTMPPDASMTTVPVFYEHNQKIEDARLAAGEPLYALIAGHKKDIVITNRLTEPDKLFIYGWHYPDGTPIQPLSGAHNAEYVDYSHGVRLVNKELMVDGKLYDVKTILQDANLYKLLSDESGIMMKTEYDTGDTSVPETPASFAVTPKDASSIEVRLKREANVTYVAQYGLSVSSMTSSVPLNADNTEISGLETGKIYYVAVKAENINGASESSEILAATPCDEATALIVNGFDRAMSGNTFDFVKEHAPALTAAGANVASATNDAVKDGTVELSDYAFVDYILGEESTADKTFDSEEQAIVKNYLQQGGSLFVSSAEIGWDLGRSAGSSSEAFLSEYLKCSFVADNPGASSGLYHDAQIINGTGLGDDNFAFSFATGAGTSVQYPDVLKPENGAVGILAYTKDSEVYSDGCAGIGFCGMFPNGVEAGKVIVMAIPFESISEEDTRNELMRRILAYDYDAGIENVGAGGLSVYPNPATSLLHVSIDCANSGNVCMEIFDTNGRSVFNRQESCEQGRHAWTVDVSCFQRGIYVCRVTTDEGTNIVKIIVK